MELLCYYKNDRFHVDVCPRWLRAREIITMRNDDNVIYNSIRVYEFDNNNNNNIIR